jgi:hypothetical protein
MSTYSKVLTVSSATYSTAPDIVLPFSQAKRIRFCNMNAADVAFISFDGFTDAGAALNNVLSPSSVQEWQWQFVSKIWLRTAGVAVQVQVLSES